MKLLAICFIENFDQLSINPRVDKKWYYGESFLVELILSLYKTIFAFVPS